MAGRRTTVEVAGRQLVVSNLDKVLYPASGFTKGEVIDYYARVSPVLLPHLAGRALTRKRYPEGVEGSSFFEKNAPVHTPAWVRTVRLPTPGSSKGREEIDFVVVEELAALVWLANLAALELHVPQWQVDQDGRALDADLLVLDLDPGPPAGIVECCEVACLLRAALGEDGLEAWVKTSGSKGLQLYVPIEPTSSEHTSGYAKMLAQRLEAERPTLVVSRMTRALRRGKVLVDWSQNNAAKTTVAPYSLRARPLPSVSTPVDWEELERCERPEDLRFLAADVLDRVAAAGDRFAPLLTERQHLPGR